MKAFPVLFALATLAGCASSPRMSACDMASALYESDRPNVHR